MKNKVVVITGGTSGIGKALAEVFGAAGSSVLVTGRNTTELDQTVVELRAKGITIAGMRADVTIEDDNRRMAEEAVRLYGTIDVLINNAGISMRALFSEVDSGRREESNGYQFLWGALRDKILPSRNHKK